MPHELPCRSCSTEHIDSAVALQWVRCSGGEAQAICARAIRRSHDGHRRFYPWHSPCRATASRYRYTSAVYNRRSDGQRADRDVSKCATHHLAGASAFQSLLSSALICGPGILGGAATGEVSVHSAKRAPGGNHQLDRTCLRTRAAVTPSCSCPCRRRPTARRMRSSSRKHLATPQQVPALSCKHCFPCHPRLSRRPRPRGVTRRRRMLRHSLCSSAYPVSCSSVPSSPRLRPLQRPSHNPRNWDSARHSSPSRALAHTTLIT